MEEKQFDAILIFLVPQVIQLIAENFSLDEIAASQKFYESNTYALLEQEDTKLWHFSPVTLFNLFEEESRTGTFLFPEET